jgi:hypothetical protein
MDVLVSTEMSATPSEVARIMFDPAGDLEWIGGARSVDAPPGNPTAIGAQTRRHGGFLGRKFSWVTEVVEHEPDALLRMKFVEGPMKGEVSYRIEPAGEGARVSIRNRGGSSFSVPGLSWMLRRSVAKDLERLKALVEG